MKVLVTGGSGFIGQNLLQLFDQQQVDYLNLDQVPPSTYGLSRWKACDLSHYQELERLVNDYAPTHVVHLAAITNTLYSDLGHYYLDNVVATENLILICETLPIQRFVLTSTQFVVGPGQMHNSDTEFSPHTAYGESKVRCEQFLRAIDPPYDWTIIRPTNIWGPMHPRYPREFWNIARRGLYVHPGIHPVIRSYGFVGNVVEQIYTILRAERAAVNHKVFYVGDEPIDLYDWSNGFNLVLNGRKAPRVNTALVRYLALLGDGLGKLNITFPITSSRYRSMTMDYPTPMAETFKALGTPKYSLEEGIQLTAEWLKSEGWTLK